MIVLNCKVKYIVPPLLLRNTVFHKLSNSTFSKTITIPNVVVIPVDALLNSMCIFHSFMHPNIISLSGMLSLSLYVRATCNFHFNFTQWLLNLEVIIIICIVITSQLKERLCNDLKTKDILCQDLVGSFAGKAPHHCRRASGVKTKLQAGFP